MGIIKGLAKDLAKAVAADVASTAVDKVVAATDRLAEKIDSKASKLEQRELKKKALSVNKLTSKNPENNHYWMLETLEPELNRSTDKRIITYLFSDMTDQIKYTARCNLEARHQKIQLFDSQGKLIGSVMENILSRAKPLSNDVGSKDYTLYLHGDACGIIRWKGMSARSLFNDWNVTMRNFKSTLISNGNENIIAEQIAKHNILGRRYFLDISNTADDVMLILVFLSEEAYSVRNAEAWNKQMDKKIKKAASRY